MAEVESLWGVAYLEDLPFIPEVQSVLGDKEEMEREVSKGIGMGYLRFRDRGAMVVDGGEVSQLFVDRLVRDLGLRTDRKVLDVERGRGWWWEKWWRECTEAYFAGDYRGLIGEYKGRWGLE